jgi:hypothetical protein
MMELRVLPLTRIAPSRATGCIVRRNVTLCIWNFFALGRSGSWPEIIADLDTLTETEIGHDGKRFTVRSAPRPAAGLAIRAAGVALPPTVREASA